LYPVLDHCFRNRHQAGIQAILIYPMNALATDQARRLAELIHGDPRLHGLRAGLYVGGGDKSLPREMSPTRLIENKQALIDDPPQILLTNYKMLDFMLLRPNERRLWQHNTPETLRYLVVDELHTFDGAQGSDVACLIRRLKARLKTPEGHLRCAGTSATIGSATDERTFEALADFAQTVFGEPFSAANVVREERVPLHELLRKPSGPLLPEDRPDLRDALVPGPDATAWLDQQRAMWSLPAGDPVALGDALLSHPLLNALLRAMDGGVHTLADVDARLAEQAPAWASADPTLRPLLLRSFLAVLSVAKRRVGSHALPLLALQLQVWARELTRLLRTLPDQADGALLPPQFAWHADGQLALEERLLAPQAHCRECGIIGLAGVQDEQDREHARLSFDAAKVGTAWLQASRTAVFVWPRPLDAAARDTELIHWLDPCSGALGGAPFVGASHQQRGAPIVLEATTRRSGQSTAFAGRCPCCEADDALRILGARAASLTSVVVTQLYQTAFAQDRKLLAFTDSVQDACHRAGFFGGRTYRIHLRTAMQAALAGGEPVPLDQAAARFEAYWRGRDGTDDTRYLAQFLPPDLREIPEFLRYMEKGGKGPHKKLFGILERRLAWEFTREFGVAAGIGRSLERSAASVAEVAPARLDAAVTQFTSWLREEKLDAGACHPRHFVFGLVHRMRHMGAIHHPFLKTYVAKEGERYLLSKQKNPHMSPVGPRSKRIRFLTSQSAKPTFPSPTSKRASVGWFGDWMRRCLDWSTPSTADLGRVYGKALDALIAAQLVEAVPGAKGATVWGLRPDALRLTTAVSAVQSGSLGRVQHLSQAEALACDGLPAFAHRSAEHLHLVPPLVGFYADVYSRGLTTRVFPGEHTGLLDREPRTELEHRFKTGSTAADPQAPNLLVCTPTLEMGVDIGDLSAALLCSVPPSPANYLQRVGRAGRKTGNALIFVMANHSPHDLYFHADPTLMLDGTVLPPGAFLGAVAMLKRQLTAWCMDQWARDDESAGPIPPQTGGLLSDRGQLHFPGRFLDYFVGRRDALLASFLERFAPYLDDEGRAELSAWVLSGTQGLTSAVQGAFADVAEQLDHYQREKEKTQRRLKKLQEDRTAVADADTEEADLKRYSAVLNSLMGELRRKYPLNVLADASVLPNYAFPERGVELHSMLQTREVEEDGQTTRRTEKRSYLRPPRRALRELAPFNTFYAEGHKVEIRQLEVGPKASRVQHWRFCAACHHTERNLADTTAPEGSACPRCGDKEWADKGRIRPVLPMNVVRAVADRVRSTTIDDSDERDKQSYNLIQLFELDAKHIVGGATRAGGFGFEYFATARMTELNLGLKSQLESGAQLNIAATPASAEGFPTCRDCGTVVDPRAKSLYNQPPPHSPFCPQRGNDTKPREPLFLFRELQSEAVRFLLPFSDHDVDNKRASFMAALNLGLRRRFQGRPMHLQVASMTQPDVGDHERRLHYLVLMDSVPGGTGYLKEYRRPERVFALLEQALESIVGCACRTRGKDGCYLCLFGHQQQHDLPFISSQLAENLLRSILDQRHLAEAVASLGEHTQASVIESELEERFVARLAERYKVNLDAVRYKLGAAEFKAGSTTWSLEAQVDVSAEADQPARADFVLRGIQGPGLDQTVVVECDSVTYHVQPGKLHARLADDVAKRQSLVARPGWRAFAITWHDLKQGGTAPELAPVFASAASPSWRAMASVQNRLGWSDDEAARARALPTTSPFDLLCAYLERPDAPWPQLTAMWMMVSLLDHAQHKQLVDPASYYTVADDLRRAPTPFPFGPMGLSARTGPKDRFARVGLAGSFGAAVSALGEHLTAVTPEGFELLLRLDDAFEPRSSDAFTASWRSFLHAMNLAQLLPNATVVTTEGLHSDSGSVLSSLGVDELSPLAAAPPAPYLADDPLRAYKAAYAEDDELWALLLQIQASGVPLPDVDPQELDFAGLTPLFTWGEHQAALCAADQLEPADHDAARAVGWVLLTTPFDPVRFAHSLKA